MDEQKQEDATLFMRAFMCDASLYSYHTGVEWRVWDKEMRCEAGGETAYFRIVDGVPTVHRDGQREFLKAVVKVARKAAMKHQRREYERRFRNVLEAFPPFGRTMERLHKPPPEPPLLVYGVRMEIGIKELPE